VFINVTGAFTMMMMMMMMMMIMIMITRFCVFIAATTNLFV